LGAIFSLEKHLSQQPESGIMQQLLQIVWLQESQRIQFLSGVSFITTIEIPPTIADETSITPISFLVHCGQSSMT